MPEVPLLRENASVQRVGICHLVVTRTTAGYERCFRDIEFYINGTFTCRLVRFWIPRAYYVPITALPLLNHSRTHHFLIFVWRHPASNVSHSGTWITTSVANQNRRLACEHIIRVGAGRSSPAFSLVSEFRRVRGRAWKCRVVRLYCRRRCRQTATCVRAVEWALAGALPCPGWGRAWSGGLTLARQLGQVVILHGI